MNNFNDFLIHLLSAGIYRELKIDKAYMLFNRYLKVIEETVLPQFKTHYGTKCITLLEAVDSFIDKNYFNILMALITSNAISNAPFEEIDLYEEE